LTILHRAVLDQYSKSEYPRYWIRTSVWAPDILPVGFLCYPQFLQDGGLE